jgi:hypothetical protein
VSVTPTELPSRVAEVAPPPPLITSVKLEMYRAVVFDPMMVP